MTRTPCSTGSSVPWKKSFGLGLSVLVPIVFALAGQMSGLTPVLAMSRLTMFTYGGLFVGPPLVGLLASITSLRFALLCVAGLLVAAAVAAHHTVAAVG
jgi:MFS family permease